MPHRQRGSYPKNWPMIAQHIKDDADWKCQRCEHPHDIEAGYVLTVHHLDGDKTNCAWWNLPPLCQRCHLTIQAKIVMNRIWLFPHSEWFRIYVAGYYARYFGYDDSRKNVELNIDFFLTLPHADPNSSNTHRYEQDTGALPT